MRKLKLQVENLEVETFEAGPAYVARGTVNGMATGGCQRQEEDPITYQMGSCNGGVCTGDYTCEESWAMGCQSDPGGGWTESPYTC